MTSVHDFWSESNQELVAIIRDEILTHGPIRFDRFMDLALYHPEHGYYRSPDPAPGRSGDFLTAPEAHPIFGATLATQVVRFDEKLGHPDEFTIVEYGAGSGRLIRPLLAELRQQHSDLYERTRYIPRELNSARRDELTEHLTHGGHVERLEPNMPESGITGCVMANEFIDAFPARRIIMTDDGLREIAVNWSDGWFNEHQIPLADPEVSAYIERHRFAPQPGESIEFHPGISGWVRELSQTLTHGFVMIIDYGYPADELFRDHRRQGTLKGYYQHGVTSELYRGVGRQDLTAHVNFSEIQWHAEALGFDVSELTTQADLLADLGIGDRLVNLQARPDLTADDYLGVRAAVLRMIDPGAMGRFRVQVLARGLDTSTSTDRDEHAPGS